jgi:hypothetical protein
LNINSKDDIPLTYYAENMRKLQPDDYRESYLSLFAMIHSGLFNSLQALLVVLRSASFTRQD